MFLCVSVFSSIKSAADIDRAGIRVGAVAGQSPTVYIQENLKHAHIEVIPLTRPHEALVKMLDGGELRRLRSPLSAP